MFSSVCIHTWYPHGTFSHSDGCGARSVARSLARFPLCVHLKTSNDDDVLLLIVHVPNKCTRGGERSIGQLWAIFNHFKGSVQSNGNGKLFTFRGFLNWIVFESPLLVVVSMLILWLILNGFGIQYQIHTPNNYPNIIHDIAENLHAKVVRSFHYRIYWVGFRIWVSLCAKPVTFSVDWSRIARIT